MFTYGVYVQATAIKSKVLVKGKSALTYIFALQSIEFRLPTQKDALALSDNRREV